MHFVPNRERYEDPAAAFAEGWLVGTVAGQLCVHREIVRRVLEAGMPTAPSPHKSVLDRLLLRSRPFADRLVIVST
jgi:hypothetical protein